MEKDVEKIINDLKKLDLASMKDTLQHLIDLVNQKADWTELGPIKDELNRLSDLLKKLQQDVISLKASSGGSGGTTVNGDLLVEITNRIEKIELRLDGLDKKLSGLARQNQGNV